MTNADSFHPMPTELLMMGFERYLSSRQWVDYRLTTATGMTIEVTCYRERAAYPYTICQNYHDQFINCRNAGEVLDEVLNLLAEVK